MQEKPYIYGTRHMPPYYSRTDAMEVKPFKINVKQEALDDLKNRLARTRWADDHVEAGWESGTDVEYMKEMADYWLRKYDWRAQEARLNGFPQFRAEVDGVGIHFIHVRGKGKNSTPIILTHGWPDSFYRFYKLIPMLTDPEKYGAKGEASFDVVVPSLPGFGFSDRRAMSGSGVADLWSELMTGVLGYKRFAAAGGDVGTWVTMPLASKHPEKLIGIHLTDVGYPTGLEDASTMSEAERNFVAACQQWLYTEGAYAMIQSTKPQTLAYGLNDSPVGLAAWQLEKFRSWSDCNGDVEMRFTKDELLTNTMIYWLTGTVGSSSRMYFENTRAIYASMGKPRQRSEVPAAVASFPKGTVLLPREWAERMVNLKRFTDMPKGGHFAAMEEPGLLAEDIRTFFGSLPRP
jgi:microsomal epoxide hydrolase